MTTASTHRISATVTRYDGDEAFPEAESFTEFCAAQLAEMFPGYEVEVEFGGKTAAFVYGGSADQDEITSLLKVDLWESFCGEGYKAYSTAADVSEVR